MRKNRKGVKLECRVRHSGRRNICRNPTRFVKPMAVDVTVGVPAHQAGRTAGRLSPTRTTRDTTKALEKTKERHHASKCKALNYDFVPAAFTSFGGRVGRDPLSRGYHLTLEWKSPDKGFC